MRMWYEVTLFVYDMGFRCGYMVYVCVMRVWYVFPIWVYEVCVHYVCMVCVSGICFRQVFP